MQITAVVTRQIHAKHSIEVKFTNQGVCAASNKEVILLWWWVVCYRQPRGKMHECKFLWATEVHLWFYSSWCKNIFKKPPQKNKGALKWTQSIDSKDSRILFFHIKAWNMSHLRITNLRQSARKGVILYTISLKWQKIEPYRGFFWPFFLHILWKKNPL